MLEYNVDNTSTGQLKMWYVWDAKEQVYSECGGPMFHHCKFTKLVVRKRQHLNFEFSRNVFILPYSFLDRYNRYVCLLTCHSRSC